MANETNIMCPKCGAEFPLTEAVSHRLREQMTAEFEEERKSLNAALTEREAKLAADQKALQEEVAQRVETERKKLIDEAAHQAEERLGTQMRDLQNQLQEKRAKLKEAQEAELKLRREQRKLEETKSSLELEVERRLAAERKKIADTARAQATEAERLNLAEKDKVISDLQHEIKNLKQKADQSSVQLQGETLELELEKELRGAFPYDDIAEVKKGQRGADISQGVRTNQGSDCGAILWEAKRARRWSGRWLAKLKEDQRAAHADLAVIVTTCPPDGVEGIGQQDGVWVCEPAFAVALGSALRQGLISTTAQRVQESNRAEKAQLLYDHVCSVEFRQHIQALVETFVGLKQQLEAEQRALAKQWKEREQQLHKALTHTAMVYGGVQGIAGREALPEIARLQLPGAA